MNKPTLYLMMGLPGAGKTTAALEIAKQTGAEHLWADKIRREKLQTPTYSAEENHKLYDEMNNQTDALLANGKSVIFDTNFKFHKDREHLKHIAAKNNAQVLICWVKVPPELAKQRALSETDHPHRPVGADMTEDNFERLASNIEQPEPDEPYVELDGTKITSAYIAEKLQLHEAPER